MLLHDYILRNLDSRIGRWLDRKIVVSKNGSLTSSTTFVFPSLIGGAYCTLVFFLLFLGIDYKNNVVLGMALFMVAVFIISIFKTYQNIAGLHIRPVLVLPSFVGEEVEFIISVSNKDNIVRENLYIYWGEDICQFRLKEKETLEIEMYLTPKKRGHFNPGRLLLSTTFPLGLFTAWGWIDLGVSTLVYPKPIAGGQVYYQGEVILGEHAIEMLNSSSGIDFISVSAYVSGHHMIRNILWKRYAKGKELFVREFQQQDGKIVWLNMDVVGGEDIETKLSLLCCLAIDLYSVNASYGLVLPNCTINVGEGKMHMEQILTAICLYDGHAKK